MATSSGHIQFIELFPAKIKPVPTVPQSLPLHVTTDPLKYNTKYWGEEADNWTTASPEQVSHSSAQGKGTGQTHIAHRPRPAQVKSNNHPIHNPRANTKVTIIKNTYDKDSSRTSGDVLKRIYNHASKPNTLEIKFDILPEIGNIVHFTIDKQQNHHVIKFPVMKKDGAEITLHQHTQESVNVLVSQIEKYIKTHKIQYVLLQYSEKDRVSYNIPRSVTEEARPDFIKLINESDVPKRINTALTTTFFNNKGSYTIYANSNAKNAIKRILKELGKTGAQASPESAETAKNIAKKPSSVAKTRTRKTPSGKGNQTKRAPKDNVIAKLTADNKKAYENAIKTIQIIAAKDKQTLTANNGPANLTAYKTLYDLYSKYTNLAEYTSDTYNKVVISPPGRGRGRGSGRGNSTTGRGRGAGTPGISKVTICKNTFITGNRATFTNIVIKRVRDKSRGQLSIVFGSDTDTIIIDATEITPYIKYTIPLYTIKDDNTVEVIRYTQADLNRLFTDLAKYIADNNIGFVLIPYTDNSFITVSTDFGKLKEDDKGALLYTFSNDVIDADKTLYSMINEAVYYTFDNNPNKYDIVYNPADTEEKHDTYNEQYKNPVNETTEISPPSTVGTNTTVDTGAHANTTEPERTNEVTNPADTVKSPEEQVEQYISWINTDLKNINSDKVNKANKHRNNLRIRIQNLKQLLNDNLDLNDKYGNRDDVKELLSMEVPPLIPVNKTPPAEQAIKNSQSNNPNMQDNPAPEENKVNAKPANNSATVEKNENGNKNKQTANQTPEKKNENANKNKQPANPKYDTLKTDIYSLIQEKGSMATGKRNTTAVSKELTDKIAELRTLLTDEPDLNALYDTDAEFKTQISELSKKTDNKGATVHQQDNKPVTRKDIDPDKLNEYDAIRTQLETLTKSNIIQTRKAEHDTKIKGLEDALTKLLNENVLLAKLHSQRENIKRNKDTQRKVNKLPWN